MPARIFALSFMICLGLAAGCMTPQTTETADTPPSVGGGRGQSMPGDASSEDEGWSKLGRQMRGDHPVEQMFDPLRDIMVSPKAQSIERSLGVDD
jgi:hypothetical protein